MTSTPQPKNHSLRKANADEERIRDEEARAREKDPHGAAAAEASDADEPKGWPTSDRHKAETTIERIARPSPGHRSK